MRLGAFFVAVCMVIIAGSAGAVAHYGFGLGTPESSTIALSVLTALVFYNTLSTRVSVRTEVDRQVSDLSRGVADLARQVAETTRRVVVLENRFDSALERARAATDPLAIELGELGTLVKQLADTVATHEAALAQRTTAPPADVVEPPREPIKPRESINELPPQPLRPAPPPPAAPVVVAPAVVAPTVAAPAMAAPPPVAVLAEPAPLIMTEPAAVPTPSAATAEHVASKAMLAVIRSAVEANRIDLYLQPIVTLPQRKVRYYEAMSRLRTDGGEMLHAAGFISHAETGGLMPTIDNLVVFRCVQVVRRLLLKNREIGLFCNLSVSTLTDATVFPQLLEFLDANRAIAPSIVLEFTQAALRSMGPIENESLSALAERGFRFSLDNLQDLRLEPRELANRGFRFIKVPAGLLLNRTAGVASDIHPADLSDLLGRFGIDLVAEKIESEGMVVDLLDYDVRYGQGFLFSPPRPVRAEALQGIAERSDVVARETSVPVGNPAAIRSIRAASPEPAAPEAKPQRFGGIAQLIRNRI
jgi:cyclic-di-GMP phosphodiesterase TipF (flagellum assembly factor)